MTDAITPPSGHKASVFVFDLARALSAMCVLAAHARGFVLQDLPQQVRIPVAGHVFFGLTALGHQAVIVFLVLSGTLVTGSVLAAFDAGRWSPAVFVATRLNRLWVVLLPCLALGAVEDAIGIAMTDPGAAGAYGAGTDAGTVLSRLDWITLAGNALFLQGFRVPVFGTNIPLWSLSVEAWCYVAALTAAVVWSVRRSPLCTAFVVVAAAAVAGEALTTAFALIAPIWGCGAALAFWLRRERRRGAEPSASASPTLGAMHGIGTAVFAMLALASARVLAGTHLVASDYVLALAVAAVLARLHDWRPRPDLRRRVRFVANISFTLYLAHFPLLSFLDAIVLRHQRLPWGAPAVVVWLAAVILALAQACGLWWLFERHTDALRDLWIGRLQRRSSPFRSTRRAVLP